MTAGETAAMINPNIPPCKKEKSSRIIARIKILNPSNRTGTKLKNIARNPTA